VFNAIVVTHGVKHDRRVRRIIGDMHTGANNETRHTTYNSSQGSQARIGGNLDGLRVIV
jgi:hypothetical protein